MLGIFIFCVDPTKLFFEDHKNEWRITQPKTEMATHHRANVANARKKVIVSEMQPAGYDVLW